MSLSDWDTLAVDERGRPCNGVSEPSPAGLVVEPHEGRLRLTGPGLWTPACLNPAPILGVVTSGTLSLYDATVLVAPGRGGLEAGIAWATYFLALDGALRAIVGVSRRGRTRQAPGGTAQWLAVEAADVRHLQRRLAQWRDAGRLPVVLTTLCFDGALRYNQGDAFLASQMGHAHANTPPGPTALPLVYQRGGVPGTA